MLEVRGRIQRPDGTLKVIVGYGDHDDIVEMSTDDAKILARQLLEAAHGTGAYSEDKETLLPAELMSGAV